MNTGTGATHKALVRRTPDSLGRTLIDLVDTPTPELKPGDVLLAPIIVGICGTDWQILRGLRTDPSPVLGHEGIAVVVAPGGDLPQGTVVAVNPTYPEFLLGHNTPGMWAERTWIPAAAVAAGLVIPIHACTSSTAALAEPTASVLYGLDIALQAPVPKPHALVVWGDGIIGHLAEAVWREQYPDIEVLMVGKSSDSAVPADDTTLTSRLNGLPPPVAAVLATPRTVTDAALQSLDKHIDGELIIDIHGGIGPESLCLRCGYVAVASIRAANCGGSPNEPVVAALHRPGAEMLWLYGHRGVPNDQLLRAVDWLCHRPESAEALVTHHYGLAEAADLINTVLTTGKRVYHGRRVLKAAIHIRGVA
jgi:2-epi-valiolone-7-phosphate 1-reductase